MKKQIIKDILIINKTKIVFICISAILLICAIAVATIPIQYSGSVEVYFTSPQWTKAIINVSSISNDEGKSGFGLITCKMIAETAPGRKILIANRFITFITLLLACVVSFVLCFFSNLFKNKKITILQNEIQKLKEQIEELKINLTQ